MNITTDSHQPRRRDPLALAAKISIGLLAYLVLGASAAPASLVRARLKLDNEVYFPGSVPTVTFASEGYPRQDYFVGDTFNIYLDFSGNPQAGITTPFAPFFMGEFNLFNEIELRLDMVTCNTEEQYIQGFVEDPKTGLLVEFTNEVLLRVNKTKCDPNNVPGGQGCGQGYWKSNPRLWPIPLRTRNKFGDIFDNAFAGKNLLRVLNTGGGSLNALGRQAVAALLNAQSPEVDFDLSPEEVVEIFNQAYPGNPGQYTTVANLFKALNTQGCD